MASEFPEVKPIHFFKIIRTQTLHQGKLMMPIKFVKQYGESLPNVIYLKTPNGAKWKLNLVKCDGKIWFEKGWKEFAKYHSLAHGHLLLFKYQTTSHFQVQIFENSALEINYPFQGNKPPSGENCRAPQKRKTNSSFEFLQQCKIGKSQKVVVHHIDKECKGKQVTTTAVERAKSFKTYNPSFVLAMGASYVDHRFLLTIPSKFGKTHFDLKKKRGDIYFWMLNGRVWPAKYTIRRCSTGLKFELTSGWKKFAKDNNLKVGDACNFELILSTNMTFQVEIFREKEKGNTNCSTSQRKCSIMANESPHMKPTHFFKLMCDQNLHEGKLIMPRKFVEKHGEGLTKIICLKTPNGEKWKLNLVKSDGKIWFEKGWKEFVEYHSLAQGNLIVFKYERNSHFEVQIFDMSAFEIKYPFKRFDAKRVFNGQKKKVDLSLKFHQPCEIGSSSCVKVEKLQKVAPLNHIDKKCKGEQLVIANKVTALDRAISFKTCNPSFHVLMCPSYLDGPSNLHIPSEFGKRHLLDLDNKQGDIHLRLLNGKFWQAKYRIRIANGVQRYEMYSSGWKEFTKDNNLKVGDACTFELLHTSSIVTFIVHIFKD